MRLTCLKAYSLWWANCQPLGGIFVTRTPKLLTTLLSSWRIMLSSFIRGLGPVSLRLYRFQRNIYPKNKIRPFSSRFCQLILCGSMNKWRNYFWTSIFTRTARGMASSCIGLRIRMSTKPKSLMGYWMIIRIPKDRNRRKCFKRHCSPQCMGRQSSTMRILRSRLVFPYQNWSTCGKKRKTFRIQRSNTRGKKSIKRWMSYKSGNYQAKR